MKLLECHVDNFGKLSNYDYRFSEGLTVIQEPNGFGKSTLAAFIKANALLRILWRRKQCKYGLARTERLLGQSVSYPDFTRKTGFQKYFGKGKC